MNAKLWILFELIKMKIFLILESRFNALSEAVFIMLFYQNLKTVTVIKKINDCSKKTKSYINRST